MNFEPIRLLESLMNPYPLFNGYPFTAIVGQDAMKLALILNVIHPSIGGVLIRGHRGAAKSTAVRGLAALLPPAPVVGDCPFRCHPEDPALMCDECLSKIRAGQTLTGAVRPIPLVNLPLGTTEDRLLGSLDLEQALGQGRRKFEAGLLARANRGLLYVDEVNLLGDHLVDLLLDAAALGVNFVERDGISFRHPSRFVLVGTMNPEEGDLRPQLLDRFGLCVEVTGADNVAERAEVARRRMAFERSPETFTAHWAREEQDMAGRIAQAMQTLPQVRVPDPILELAARFSLSFETEGHRSEITMVRTAMALCAFRGIEEVSSKELYQAAEWALPHRIKKHGLRQAEVDTAKLRELMEESRSAPQESPQDGSQVQKKKFTVL